MERTRKREERERKHGNAGWAPCVSCNAFGTIKGYTCAACKGIGFVPHNNEESNYVNHYVIDWDKVQTLDDVKRLIKAMNITFEPDCVTLKGVEDLVRPSVAASAGERHD
jgi:hypothetical protein